MSRAGSQEPHIEVPLWLEEALERALRELAARRQTTTYRALADALCVPPPYHLRQVMLALEARATKDHARGRAFLSALVVSRTRGPLPAPGFFAHLKTVGAYAGAEEGEDARRWHERELVRVFAESGSVCELVKPAPGNLDELGGLGGVVGVRDEPEPPWLPPIDGDPFGFDRR